MFEKEEIKNNVGISLSLTWDENLNLFTKVEYYLDDELRIEGYIGAMEFLA